MTHPMTPERELEIRSVITWEQFEIDEINKVILELLAEIDRLRTELQTSLVMTEANIRIAKDMEKERDEYKAYKIAALKELLDLKAENDRIKSERRVQYALLDELSELQEHRDVYNKNRKDLLAENGKLRIDYTSLREHYESRVGELSERLEKLEKINSLAADELNRWASMSWSDGGKTIESCISIPLNEIDRLRADYKLMDEIHENKTLEVELSQFSDYKEIEQQLGKSARAASDLRIENEKLKADLAKACDDLRAAANLIDPRVWEENQKLRERIAKLRKLIQEAIDSPPQVNGRYLVIQSLAQDDEMEGK